MDEIILGDCLEEMKKLPENSVDSVVTDPPYGLSFMGKKWDYDVPSTEMWKEALRVLKPGGYLLSFAGTRTQHRIAVNIEDAGFEIRDMIAWVYGSGFPKSHNIGKAVDKLQGNEREFVSENPANRPYNLTKGETSTGWKSPPRPDKDKGTSEYEGWGTALKPALEPITVARKPLSEKTVADNVLKWGTGGINIDGCRVGTEVLPEQKAGQAQIGTFERDNMVTPERTGRFPANLIHDGSQEVMDLFPDTGQPCGGKKKTTHKDGMFGIGTPGTIYTESDKGNNSAGRFFASFSIGNECFLCYNPLRKATKGELWKSTNVDNAEENLKITKVTKENTAQKSATQNLNDKSAQLVKYVGNLCEKCATNIVQNLVVISENQKGSQYQEESQAIQDFIGNYRKCILLQNLASYVERLDSIDTTPITQNLLKLFGCVLPAITSYIQEIEKTAPKRFLYQAKASKKDRNEGCEGMDIKRKSHMQTKNGTGERSMKEGFPDTYQQNNHPTVKPTNLMRYLVRLVTPKGGTVLDPFMGSGSTGKACKLEGFDFIGIEKDEEYVEIARRRI